MQHPVITLYKVYGKIFPLPHPPVFLTKIVWIVHVSVNKCRSYPGRGDFLLSCPVPHCYGVIFIVLDWCKIFSLASLMKTNTKYSVTRSIACDHHGTHKRMLRLAEQGWHSGELRRLPLTHVAPVRILDPASYCKNHLCSSLVLHLATRIFRRVL